MKYKLLIIDSDVESSSVLKSIVETYCINISKIFEYKCLDCSSLGTLAEMPDIIIANEDQIDKFYKKFANSKIINAPLIVSFDKAPEMLRSDLPPVVGFLQKPYTVENIVRCINEALKALEKYAEPEDDSALDFDILSVSSLDRVDVFKMPDIMYCMAEGKYTTFYLANGKSIVSSKNLGEYEKILHPNFVRVHNAYIINLIYLSGIIKKDGVYCEMQNKTKIPVSKRKHESFIKLIKVKFQ